MLTDDAGSVVRQEMDEEDKYSSVIRKDDAKPKCAPGPPVSTLR